MSQQLGFLPSFGPPPPVGSAHGLKRTGHTAGQDGATGSTSEPTAPGYGLDRPRPPQGIGGRLDLMG